MDTVAKSSDKIVKTPLILNAVRHFAEVHTLHVSVQMKPQASLRYSIDAAEASRATTVAIATPM